MVDRLPVLTLLVIPDQDPGPVQVQPRPEEAGVGDLEAGPGAGGWAGQAGVGGRGEELLCPHPRVGDCLRVHVLSVTTVTRPSSHSALQFVSPLITCLPSLLCISVSATS